MSKLKKIILGIVAVIVVIIVLAMVATQGIADVASSQLKALRNDDLVKAYSYTSKDFQKATSLDKFKIFVDSYPSLKNNENASFSDRVIENNMGKLSGSLKSKDGAVTPIEYNLVKENGEWKILNMKLNPAGAGITTNDSGITTGNDGANSDGSTKTLQKETQSAGTITDIKLSDTTDSRGIVVKHKDIYSSTTPEIFVSAYIENAQKGGNVSAGLVYTATGDTVGPVSNVIEQDGARVSNFSFTKPTKGWPEGTFKVMVKLSSGDIKSVTFEVK